MRKGYVKTVVMGDVGEEFANDPELVKAKGVQLIKQYQESEEEGEEGDEKEEDEGEEGKKCEGEGVEGEKCEGGVEGGEGKVK